MHLDKALEPSIVLEAIRSRISEVSGRIQEVGGLSREQAGTSTELGQMVD